MPNMKLLAAQRNVSNAERLGQTERAKRAKARVAELEKADAAVSDLEGQSVADVLSSVGDDASLAVAALEAESVKEKPRKSLVTGLEAVVANAQEPEEN